MLHNPQFYQVKVPLKTRNQLVIQFHYLTHKNTKKKKYDMVSAIVEVSLPRAAYFDIPQIGEKLIFLKQNH